MVKKIHDDGNEDRFTIRFLFTNASDLRNLSIIMHEDNLLQSPKYDYLAVVQLNSSGIGNACQRTASVLQVHDKDQ